MYVRKISESIKMPPMFVGMGTEYSEMNLFSCGTANFETVLNSTFSWKGESFPIVLVGILILSTRKVEISAVALKPSIMMAPVNLISMRSNSTASSVVPLNLGQNWKLTVP